MARAKRYELNESELGEQKFKGQAALVVRSLLDRHPQTAQEIADDIKAKLTTRQEPLRVVGFYLSTWKKAGLIVVSADEAPVAAGKSSEAPVVPDNAPEEQDERDLAQLETQAEVLPTNGYDYVNSPLSEAIVTILTNEFADPASPKLIADELNVAGRTVTAKQVSDAMRRLLQKGSIVKVEEGSYAPAR